MAKTTPSSSPNESQLELDQAFTLRMDKLRMRHLRLLDHVARHGSLSAAAGHIGMSQPAATKMLQELEEAFNCKLIERSVKGGALTSAGVHVLDRLRVALQSISTAHAATNSNPSLPMVRLGIIPLVGIKALTHVVNAMRAENQKLQIQIKLGTVESLIKGLSDGEVDCVVGFLDETTISETTKKLKVTTLWEEKLVVVAAKTHALMQRKKVSLQMIGEFDWVLMPRGSANRRAVENQFLNFGLLPPAPCIETESFHIAMSLIAGSEMLTAVPESAHRQYQSDIGILSTEARFPTTRLVFVTLDGVHALPMVESLSQKFRTYSQWVHSRSAKQSIF